MDKKKMKAVEKLIDKQKVVFVSSVDQVGYPNTKAMLAPRKRMGLQTFYLTTNTSARHISQLRENPKASLYFCDQRGFSGVMLLGTVEALEDQVSKEMLWQEGDTMYYPEGVTDPNYCVIRFTATGGRYYSNLESEDFSVVENDTAK